jgi:cytochrome c
MKKIILVLSMIAVIAGCGSNETKKPAASENKPAPGAPNPDNEKGLDLIVKSDCLTCHKVMDAFTGPAYIAIAKKYAGQPGIEDSLASKIIKGGSGVWGTIPMTAHPTVSEDDAKMMVKYILSLNEQQ